jgi:type I restriction enzyme, S subunit
MSSAQLPEGYKQTEVGVIPEDWELKTIGDLASVGSGGTPSRTNLSYWDGPIPWITTTQIDCNFIHDAEQFITQDGLDNSAAKLFPPGTLLMAMYGQGKTRGKVAILGVQASTNQACAAILLGKNLEHSYAFHYLSSQYEAIRNLSNTGNQENLNGFIIKSIKIPLPPLPEQRSIAQALSDVDALIASLDKLIAKQRHLKTAAMQQLLTGKMRSPGFGEGKGYKQTEIGVIPEDWDVRYLGEVGQSLIGLTYRPEDTRDHGTLVLRSSNVQNDRLAYENNVYVDSSLPLPSRVIVEEGDILICVRNGSKQLIGKCALIDAEAAGSAFGAFMSVFRTKISGFVFYQFQSDVIQTQINEIMGATINQITNKDMAAFQIPLPPSDEEQRAITTVLSEMDTAIAALETRRSKTQAIKQGMMQELLTGRTRLV